MSELLRENDNVNDHRGKLLRMLSELSPSSAPQDPLTKFFVRILTRFTQYIFPTSSVMQQANVSEASYAAYIIHPCLIDLVSGIEDYVNYKPGEIIIESIGSCNRRRKSGSAFEQRADGIMFACLPRMQIEIGHLEMSGGYDHKELPRSTWDGCCKGPVGCAYMLEEIGENFRGSTLRSYAETKVFFLHTYEDRAELWQMHCRARGVLQLERTHKAIVPVSFAGQRKHLFDFVLLWDFRSGLLETARRVRLLQEEDNDNLTGISDLSGALPPHPLVPNKEKHKKAVTDVLPNSDGLSSPLRWD